MAIEYCANKIYNGASELSILTLLNHFKRAHFKPKSLKAQDLLLFWTEIPID